MAEQFHFINCWDKVIPYLKDFDVQKALTLGMARLALAKNMSSYLPPYRLGELDVNAPTNPPKYTYYWYRPHKECHFIALFAHAIGMKLYPHLSWKYLSGSIHTIAVGFNGGSPSVVMDYLHFDKLSANQSIDYCSDGQEFDDGLKMLTWREITYKD